MATAITAIALSDNTGVDASSTAIASGTQYYVSTSNYKEGNYLFHIDATSGSVIFRTGDFNAADSSNNTKTIAVGSDGVIAGPFEGWRYKQVDSDATGILFDSSATGEIRIYRTP